MITAGLSAGRSDEIKDIVKRFPMRSASDIPGEITKAAFEHPGDLCECFKGDLLFSALNITDIIARQIGFFGQFLLAQTELFSAGANGVSHDSINFARG